MTITLSVGLLILRLVLGGTLAAHGLQKVIPWQGSQGFVGLKQGLGKQGFKPAWFWAALAVVGELGGGLSVAAGLLTPLGAAGIVGAMGMAVFKTHWKHGFWASKHGYEYALALLAVAVTIGLTGPGTYSFDALFGLTALSAPLFGVLALAALLVDAIGMLMTRPATVTPSESAPKAA